MLPPKVNRCLIPAVEINLNTDDIENDLSDESDTENNNVEIKSGTEPSLNVTKNDKFKNMLKSFKSRNKYSSLNLERKTLCSKKLDSGSVKLSVLPKTPISVIDIADADEDDDISITPSPPEALDEISSTPPEQEHSDDTMLKLVMEKYTFDELIAKYHEKGNEFTSKSMNIVSKNITNVMKTDEKMKSTHLELISEIFSNDILRFAVQENSSDDVCNFLSNDNLIKFIIEKAKTNGDVKKKLLQNISAILTDETEMTEDLYKILLTIINCDMSGVRILTCLDAIFKKRLAIETVQSQK